MGRIPSWYKGMQVECHKCGWWYGEKDPRMKRQEGHYVCRQCYDKLTKKQRLDQKRDI